jgi:glycosyltransferase involved in cell wall biosynthesis
MQISVVIPSYNRLSTLIRAIDSVIAQTSKVDEIIIVDDGSSDNTAVEVSARYPQLKLLRQENSGVSSARNYGIKQAKGDWIALLDSDDSWLPNKIERIRKAQRLNPEISLFHSDEIWIRNGVRVNAMNKHQKSGGWIFQQCLPLCVISPSAVVIKRSLFDVVGFFDESLPACEDYDLWLRVCHRFPVHYIDHPLINKYGGHQDQLSNQFWGMDRFRIRALKNLLADAEFNADDLEAAENTLKHKLKILLKGANKHGNQYVIDEFKTLFKII